MSLSPKQRAILAKLKADGRVELPYEADRAVRSLFKKGLVSYRSQHVGSGDSFCGWLVTPPTAPKLKRYEVHMTFKHPAHDERDGYRYDVDAHSKSEACKRARKLADNEGHDGVRWFKATEVTAS